MSKEDLFSPFPWHSYSKKMAAKIENPRCMGIFTFEDAAARGMRLVEGREGHLSDGNAVFLYWLVDPIDGIIVDAKFQVFGQSALIAAADGACELVIGKNYDQIRRFNADLIDKHLRDRLEEEAFPPSTKAHLNLVIGAIESGVEQCLDLPLPTHYETPFSGQREVEKAEGYPHWELLSKEDKIKIIEETLNEEVRPYIALDAGGIEVLDLINGYELLISYQGSCTSCFSSIGTTLSTIQQIIQTKIHPTLKVVPDLNELKFL